MRLTYMSISEETQERRENLRVGLQVYLQGSVSHPYPPAIFRILLIRAPRCTVRKKVGWRKHEHDFPFGKLSMRLGLSIAGCLEFR